tara:strand:+ start:1062 stop:1262 length:201 start_codon:yes stop_codon:yes gene_type:complete
MEIKVVLEEQEEGGYTVFVPALAGCISEGDTKEKAIENIKEALALYLDTELDEIIGRKGQIMSVAV